MTTVQLTLQRRSRERLPDSVWKATLRRIRGEFDEMPCMRVTPDQATVLFGVPSPVIRSLLDRLTTEGFLSRTDQGEYTRRQAMP
jgi:hypothetical protein